MDMKLRETEMNAKELTGIATPLTLKTDQNYHIILYSDVCVVCYD